MGDGDINTQIVVAGDGSDALDMFQQLQNQMGQTQDALGDMNDSQGEVTASTNDASSAFDDLIDRMGGAAGAANLLTTATSALLGVGIVAWLHEGVAGAESAQLAMASLQIAVKNTGASFDEAEPKIKSLLDQLTANGLSTTTDMTKALSTLTTQTGSLTKAMALMPIVEQVMAFNDLKGTQMDASQAAQQLGLILMGNTRLLKQYGVSATEIKDPVDRVIALFDKVQGSDQLYLQTEAGKTQQLKTELTQLDDEMGDRLLPYQEKVTEAQLSMVKTFSDMPGPIQNGIVAVALLAAQMGTLGGLANATGLNLRDLTSIIGGGFAGVSEGAGLSGALTNLGASVSFIVESGGDMSMASAGAEALGLGNAFAVAAPMVTTFGLALSGLAGFGLGTLIANIPIVKQGLEDLGDWLGSQPWIQSLLMGGYDGGAVATTAAQRAAMGMADGSAAAIKAAMGSSAANAAGDKEAWEKADIAAQRATLDLQDAKQAVADALSDKDYKAAEQQLNDAISTAAQQREDILANSNKQIAANNQQLADEEKSLAATVASQTKSLWDTYTNQVNSAASRLQGAFGGIFGVATPTAAWNDTSVLSHLHGQENALTTWMADLGRLKSKGFSAAVIADIQTMGPSADAQIKQLLQMSTGQISDMNSTYAAILKTTHSEAVNENQNIYNDTIDSVKRLNRDAATQLATYKKNWEDTNTSIAQDTKKQLSVVQAEMDKAITAARAAMATALADHGKNSEAYKKAVLSERDATLTLKDALVAAKKALDTFNATKPPTAPSFMSPNNPIWATSHNSSHNSVPYSSDASSTPVWRASGGYNPGIPQLSVWGEDGPEVTIPVGAANSNNLQLLAYAASRLGVGRGTSGGGGVTVGSMTIIVPNQPNLRPADIGVAVRKELSAMALESKR